MNAMSTIQAGAAVRVWTDAAIRPVARVTSNAQRATTAAVADRYESSASRPALPAVTYGRCGRCAGAPDQR